MYITVLWLTGRLTSISYVQPIYNLVTAVVVVVAVFVVVVVDGDGHVAGGGGGGE